MKKVLLIFIAIYLFLLPYTAQAVMILTPIVSKPTPTIAVENTPTPPPANGWEITNFTSNIHVNTNGSITVEEKIFAHFDIPKHGIYRDIPFIYQNENGQQTYSKVTVLHVLQDNKPAEYSEYNSGNYKEIKIGDKNATITGPVVYEIDYNVLGVLRGFPNYDELYWNATGNMWDAPIYKASATIILPENGVVQVSCYQGAQGSTEQCQSNKVNYAAIFTTTRALNSNEGLTVAVGYKKGLVPLATVSQIDAYLDFLTVPVLLAFLLPVIAGLLFLYFNWLRHGRDYWMGKFGGLQTANQQVMPVGAHDTTVVEFEPPEKLRPAEIGVLMDEKADTLDVTATIIDLATRGFLTIREVSKTWLFGQTDYQLTKQQKDTTELLPYEKYLFDQLFKTGNQVMVSELKYDFYSELAEVKNKLYTDVVNKKLYPSNPESVRSKYSIIGTFLLIIPLANLIFVHIPFPILAESFLFGIGIVGLLTIIFSRFMPSRTAYGHELYRRSLGYKLFISTAEKYRQRFFEKENMFNEVLPYAIVFGVTDKFAKAMKDIGIQTTPTWYYGTTPFQVDTFGERVTSFSSSFSSAIAATPKGSGSGGGGFSGGGFGGGGGGSW